MPWRQEAMKDVVSCEKLRGVETRVDPQMLPPELLVQTQIAGNSQTAAMLSRGNEGRLFRFALMGLLALLFCETYLAWRFGSSSL